MAVPSNKVVEDVVGPLQGVKIVELAGIGPGPFAGMLLSDMGADIVRIDRAGQVNPGVFDKPNLEPLYRGRRSIGVDLKKPEGVELVLRLVEQADALTEGYRPGVTERLGLGPDVCLARNPKLIHLVLQNAASRSEKLRGARLVVLGLRERPLDQVLLELVDGFVQACLAAQDALLSGMCRPFTIVQVLR